MCLCCVIVKLFLGGISFGLCVFGCGRGWVFFVLVYGFFCLFYCCGVEVLFLLGFGKMWIGFVVVVDYCGVVKFW